MRTGLGSVIAFVRKKQELHDNISHLYRVLCSSGQSFPPHIRLAFEYLLLTNVSTCRGCFLH